MNAGFRLLRSVTMVITGLLVLLVCHPVNAADMVLRIQAPDVALMPPPVSQPQMRQEGLPLSWENSTVKDFIGYLKKGAYKEALAYLREKEGSFLDMIEKGDPDGRLKRQAGTGGIVWEGAPAGPGQNFNKTGQISAYMLYLIGHTYFCLEKYRAAETSFLAALIPMPDYIRVHESLGLLYLRLGRYEDAGRYLAHAAGLGLHTAEMYGAMGYLYYQTGNFWGAANAFQKALMLAPDNEQWKRGQLQALSRSHQHQDALTLVGSMLKENPDDAGLWLFRAKAALGAGEREEALSSLETAIRLGDANGSNLDACAILHMEVGSMERGMELLKGRFVEGMDFLLVDRAMNWLEQAGKWTLLEQMLVSVRGWWSDLDALQRSRVLTREADINLHKGNKSAAGKSLEQAIALDPSNADALMSLAGIYRGKGNHNLAELLYRRVGAYDPYRVDAQILLAQLAMDQDDFEHALQILRDVLKAFPNRADVNRNIKYLEDLVLLQKDA